MNKDNIFSEGLNSLISGDLVDKSLKLTSLIAETNKGFEKDESKVLDFVFNYLPNSQVSDSNNIFDGVVVVTNKHIFIIDLETSTKWTYDLRDTKLEIVNAQNLFNKGVTRKYAVSVEHDPHFIVSNTQYNISFWILDSRGSVASAMSIPGFAADNYYYGLYLVFQSLKNKSIKLTEATDIFYYRRKGKESSVVVLPIILFIIAFSAGVILSLISGKVEYFPISLMIGILVIFISLFIGIPYLIISKKIFDASLRRKARKTFSVNSDNRPQLV